MHHAKHATIYKGGLKLKWEASAMPQNSGQKWGKWWTNAHANMRTKGPKTKA